MSRSLFFSPASQGSRAELYRDETARGRSTSWLNLNSVATDVAWYKLNPAEEDASEPERAPIDLCSGFQGKENEIREDLPIPSTGQSTTLSNFKNSGKININTGCHLCWYLVALGWGGSCSLQERRWNVEAVGVGAAAELRPRSRLCKSANVTPSHTVWRGPPLPPRLLDAISPFCQRRRRPPSKWNVKPLQCFHLTNVWNKDGSRLVCWCTEHQVRLD